jgi:hypothetical protein
MAAGMTPELVEWLDEYRRHDKNDLADTRWYEKMPRPAGLHFPAELLVVRSETFRVTAVGRQGQMTERVTGVVRREADRRQIRLLSWKVD